MPEYTSEILMASNLESIERAAAIVQAGGLVAFPTDTVYGLGASIDHPQALEGIYKVKGRGEDKPLPVLIYNAADIEILASQDLSGIAELADRFWPGPLTIILEKSKRVPDLVSRGPTVGLRVPDHPTALALLQLTGPLAVTSANRSGKDSPSTVAAVLNQLDGDIDIVLDGGDTPGGVPSTVLDCSVRPAQILRQGPIDRSQLEDRIELEAS